MKITKADILRALSQDAKDPKSLVIKAIVGIALSGGALAMQQLIEAARSNRRPSSSRPTSEVEKLTRALTDATKERDRLIDVAVLADLDADKAVEIAMALIEAHDTATKAADTAKKVVDERTTAVATAKARRDEVRLGMRKHLGLSGTGSNANGEDQSKGA